MMKRFLLVGILSVVGCRFVGGKTAVLQTTPTPVSASTSQPTNQQTIEPTNQPISNLQSPVSNPANADVLFVKATETAPGIWTFAVTVAHPDTGWEDYADGWDVLLPDGTAVLPDPAGPFTRLLLHPHETEQPFTRSQSNIMIPEEVTAVTVRAHDLVDGFGGEEMVVDLATGTITDSYEVVRFQE